MKDKMKYPSKIAEIADLAVKHQCTNLAAHVYNNTQFQIWSGSSKSGQHHYGNGGLQFHTWEVLSLAERNADFLESLGQVINRRVLFLSCLYHDFGKIHDYKTLDGENWVGTIHKRRIHHISRSALLWQEVALSYHLTKELTDDVLHCILSHHGQREWGSPVAPASREAWILFLSDGISARCNDCDTLDMVGQVKHV